MDSDVDGDGSRPDTEPQRVRAAVAKTSDMIGEGRDRLTELVRDLEARRGRTPAVDLMFQAIERDRSIHGGTLAAALAFRFFLFLLPITLVLIVILGFVIDSDPASSQDLVDRFGLSGALAEALQEATDQGRANRWWALGVGLAGTAWAARGCVRAIRLGHFLAWRLRPERMDKPYHGIAAFVGAYAVLLMAPLLAGWAHAIFGVMGEVVGAAGVFGTYVLLWMQLSRLLPHAARNWRYLFPGALLLALGTQAIQLVTAYFLAPRLESAASVYGAIGVAAVMLTWLFLIARLILSAAIVNAVFEERRTRRRRPAPTVGGSGEPTPAVAE